MLQRTFWWRRCFVVVRLNVGVRHRFVEARDDRLDGERGRMRKRIRKDVSRCNIDGLQEEVVFQDNKAGVERRGVSENVFPVEKNLANAGGTTVDVEV